MLGSVVRFGLEERVRDRILARRTGNPLRCGAARGTRWATSRWRPG